MTIDWTAVTGVITIGGAILTAYLTYRIWKCNRLDRAWLALTAAFILIIFRRAIGFATSAGYAPDLAAELIILEDALLVIISVLNIIGFGSMLKSFERFDLIEHQTATRASQQNLRRRTR